MKKLITICVTAGLMFALGTPVANGSITINYGTPSPSLSPTFGTLVNFDDKAAGTQVMPNDYALVGVASITELTGAGSLFARYPYSAQSPPNYVGTGSHDNGGTPGGWDGTIRIDLALPASMVGIGIMDGWGGTKTFSVYNSIGTLLESYPVQAAAFSSVYPVITRGSYDISRLVITGDFFGIDDLQFNTPTISLEGLKIEGLKLE